MRRWIFPGALVLALGLAMSDLVHQQLSAPSIQVSAETRERKPATPQLFALRQMESLAALSPATMTQHQPTALDVAQAFLSQHAREWQLRDYHRFEPEVFESPLGTRVRFSVAQDGVPVLGMKIELDISSDLQATLVDKRYVPLEKADLDAKTGLTPEEILQGASGFSPAANAPAPARVLFAPPAGGAPVLAYVMTVHEKTSGRLLQVVFRASDGQILRRGSPRSEL